MKINAKIQSVTPEVMSHVLSLLKDGLIIEYKTGSDWTKLTGGLGEIMSTVPEIVIRIPEQSIPKQVIETKYWRPWLRNAMKLGIRVIYAKSKSVNTKCDSSSFNMDSDHYAIGVCGFSAPFENINDGVTTPNLPVDEVVHDNRKNQILYHKQKLSYLTRKQRKIPMPVWEKKVGDIWVECVGEPDWNGEFRQQPPVNTSYFCVVRTKHGTYIPVSSNTDSFASKSDFEKWATTQKTKNSELVSEVTQVTTQLIKV